VANVAPQSVNIEDEVPSIVELGKMISEATSLFKN
jgi:hypothetical protein